MALGEIWGEASGVLGRKKGPTRGPVVRVTQGGRVGRRMTKPDGESHCNTNIIFTVTVVKRNLHEGGGRG